RVGHRAEADHRAGIAVVSGGDVGRGGDIVTFVGDVGGHVVEHRRGRVADGDVLMVGGRVAAGIGGNPGPNDHVTRSTSAGVGDRAEADHRAGIAVVGGGDGRRGGDIVAFVGNVGRYVVEHRRGGIANGDVLMIGGRVAAGIGGNPGPNDHVTRSTSAGVGDR